MLLEINLETLVPHNRLAFWIRRRSELDLETHPPVRMRACLLNDLSRNPIKSD